MLSYYITYRTKYIYYSTAACKYLSLHIFTSLIQRKSSYVGDNFSFSLNRVNTAAISIPDYNAFKVSSVVIILHNTFSILATVQTKTYPYRNKQSGDVDSHLNAKTP